MVVPVSGSVVTLPLVGWAPVHPPDAVQVWASFALHCNLAGVPIATLLVFAVRATAGLTMLLAAGLVWLDDDC